MSTSSTEHLKSHQGESSAYVEVVSRTAAGRLGPIWWGVLEQHVPLADDATVVDLGTGPGHMLEMLRERHPGARLLGVEVVPLMLEKAREVAARCGAEIVAADLAARLPLPDDFADAVTAVMTFHELIYPPQMLVEARRLLKKGGKLVLYDWVKRPMAAYLEGMQKELSPESLRHFREHCLFSADDLSFMVEQAGFEVCEVVGRRGGNYSIVVAAAA